MNLDPDSPFSIAAILLSLVTKSFKQFKPSQIIQDLSEKANCFQSIETLENQKRK